MAARLSRRLERLTYTVPGPYFIWHIDGCDKLKSFGLCISGCIDRFSKKKKKKNIWLNVYNTNNNPRGDYGTESGLVRDLQTFLWNSRTRDSILPSYVDGSSTGNQRGFIFRNLDLQQKSVDYL